MNVLPSAFRVRRAARQPGQADTVLALEWLGGEALVAPLPAMQDEPRARRAPRARADDVAPDWCVI